MSKLIRTISVFLTSVLLTSLFISFPLYADQSETECLSVSSDYEFTVSTAVTATWPSHANVEFTFTNIGNNKIENWYLIFDTTYTIENIWNCSIVDTDGEITYTICGANWNRDIEVGSSVTVGMTLASEDGSVITNLPDRFILNTAREIVSPDSYSITYVEYSRWEDGFNGVLTIRADETIEDWELSAVTNEVITQASGAVLTLGDNGQITFTNDGSNQDIEKDNLYSIYIQGVNTTGDLQLTDLVMTTNRRAFTLTEDNNDNGIPDYIEAVGITPTPEPTVTPEPTATTVPTTTSVPTVTSKPTVTPTITQEPTVTPTVQMLPTDTPTATPTVTSVPIPTLSEDEYWTDSDGDSLYDGEELEYGTDPYITDTDNDGIPDFEEVSWGYNPLSPDSNHDGVEDGDEDEDEDGLPNSYEVANGTCWFAGDSDYDGLSDYDEFMVFLTDPRNDDTDGDGVPDGDEVILGKNPSDNADGSVKTEQTIDYSIDNDDDGRITDIHVTMELSGIIDHEVRIRDMYNVDLYSTDAYGRVGSPVEIECEEEFDSATIVFEYDPSFLEVTNEEDLVVLWYDREHNVYDIQEQSVVDTINNTISLEVSHFSDYMVVDRVLWENPIEPDYSEYIMLAEYSTEYVAWSGREPDIDYMERDSFIWWGFSHPGDYVIVETIVADKSCADEGNRLEHWEYSFVWLVMNVTDSDSDGVPDVCERHGVMGSNRKVYHSNPNLSDSDGDGLDDNDEMGPIYVLYRGENGRDIGVIVDGKIVYCNNYGRFPSDSPYYFLNEYLPGLGQYRYLTTSETDALMPDSDGDGFNDIEDAIPRTVNEDVVYLFSSPDFYDQSQFRKTLYEENGLTVIWRVFFNMDSFVDLWNGIGSIENNTDIDEVNDKYYYDVSYVVICAHGNNNSMVIGESGQNPDMLYSSSYYQVNDITSRHKNPDDLEMTRVYSLNLYACSCGKRTAGNYSLADDFLSSQTEIEQVIAADTNLIGRNNQYYFRAYDESIVLTENQFNDLMSDLWNLIDTREYVEYSNIGRIDANSQGFLVFKRDYEPIDYYNDDVLFGTLYINEENSSSGVFIYHSSVDECIGNRWHDPVID